MDFILVLSGLIIGFIISYIIFNLRNKTKNVSRSVYDDLNNKFNEINTQLKILEDRLLNHQQEYLVLNAKYESKEKEVLVLQGEINLLKQKNAEEKIKNDSLQSANDTLQQKNLKLEEQLENANQQIRDVYVENTKLIANNKTLQEKLDTQKEEIIEIQKTSHLQFENIANKILEEKTGKFTETNKASIEALLKPLGENIDIFKKRVEETYDKESKQRFSLEEKVKELIEQTNKVSSEANNLANALKGQVKKQGDWGEMILESILEKSGLVKNREYFVQQTIKDDNGKSVRPDVLVKLPDNRVIIIDSKVSLVAYDRFVSAETTEEQTTHLSDHLKSIYSHINELHCRAYDNMENALNFTMMFIPIEPAYLISIQKDQDLWAYAYSKRILLISPTNLIACLKLMSDLWKREMQSKNAMDIVKRGEALYEKFVSFACSLEDLGKYLNKSQQSYNSAIRKLSSGSGNLVTQALKLKNLGLKSGKEIPSIMLPDDFEAEETVEKTEIDSEL